MHARRLPGQPLGQDVAQGSAPARSGAGDRGRTPRHERTGLRGSSQEEPFDQRRFADAGVAFHHDQLTSAFRGRLEGATKLRQFALAADERWFSRLRPALRLRQVVRHARHEPVAASSLRFDELRRRGVVAEGAAKVPHVGSQHIRLYVGRRPERLEQFVLWDEAAGVQHEMAKHLKRARAERDLGVAAKQRFVVELIRKRPNVFVNDHPGTVAVGLIGIGGHLSQQPPQGDQSPRKLHGFPTDGGGPPCYALAIGRRRF